MKYSLLFKDANHKLQDELTDDQIESLNNLLKITPELINSKENDIITKRLIKKCEELNVKVIMDLPYIGLSYYSIKSNGVKEIHISKDPIACIFAHEIGHAIADSPQGSKGGRISHKLYFISKSLLYLMSSIYGLILIGYIGNRSKIENKKLATCTLTAFALPFISFSPVLYNERYASKTALELCKELGASDRYLELSKISLNAAYKTYVLSGLSRSIIISLALIIGNKVIK